MLCYVLRSSQQRSQRRGRKFGNEPIGTSLLWPPVLLLLATVLLTSGRASLASRVQRTPYTNQVSRPIVTTCASNHGSSHVAFSLGGSEMLSPSCRLAEQPLFTYRLSKVSITTAERSRHISLQINGLYRVIRLNLQTLLTRFILYCILEPSWAY